MDLDSALTGKPAEGTTATDLLRADHREVSGLFGEYERARGAGHARAVIAQTIAMQLELHDTIEREVFYPAVQSFAERLVEAAMREHDEIARLIEKLKVGGMGDTSDKVVIQLKRLVEEHVREEEQALFPAVEEIAGRGLIDLGRELIKRKEEVTRSTEAFEGPAT